MSVPQKTVSPNVGVSSPPLADAATSGWTWLALLVTLIGLVGTLSLSLGMGLRACPLCFYQRAFVMSVFAVLAVGLATGAVLPGRLALLVLAPTTAGLGVAIFHVYLEAAGKLECPLGIFSWGTAPKQSLAMFAVLFAILLVDALRGVRVGAVGWTGVAGTVVLGALLAAASCTTNPPMPPLPKEPYAKPPDICRPPYRP
jgi:disulfide bond formation protein DsbB